MYVAKKHRGIQIKFCVHKRSLMPDTDHIYYHIIINSNVPSVVQCEDKHPYFETETVFEMNFMNKVLNNM